MAVCASYRIPHSEFLNWSALDRGKAIWWHTRRATTCQQCGTRPEEFEDDPHSYVGVIAHCRGCEIRAKEQEVLDRADKGMYRRGSYVTLMRNPG